MWLVGVVSRRWVESMGVVVRRYRISSNRPRAYYCRGGDTGGAGSARAPPKFTLRELGMHTAKKLEFPTKK